MAANPKGLRYTTRSWTPGTSKQELYPVRGRVPSLLGLLKILRPVQLKADPRTYKVCVGTTAVSVFLSRLPVTQADMSRGLGDTKQRGPPNTDEMVTLKVDNISYECGADVLREAFERYGYVGDVYIPRDIRTGNIRGFAFVRFLDTRDADDAIEGLDGKSLAGRMLRIQYAKRRRQYGGTGGRGGYDGGGRGRGGGGGYADEGGDRYGDRRDHGRGGERSRSPRRRSRSPPPRRRSNSRSRSRSPVSRKDRRRDKDDGNSDGYKNDKLGKSSRKGRSSRSRSGGRGKRDEEDEKWPKNEERRAHKSHRDSEGERRDDRSGYRGR